MVLKVKWVLPFKKNLIGKALLQSLVVLFFLICALTVTAQDVNGFLKEAHQLEIAQKEEEALSNYQQVLKLQPSNLVALCKCSELCSRIGNRQPLKNNKVTYFKAGKKYAEAALKINPNYAEANFVMAMSMGRMAMISSGHQKIEAVNDIKKYAEINIRLDPASFKGYHVLGKWHYEVSNLNAIERTAAKIFFGGMPAASLAESIKYYEKSKLLAPDFNLNYLELAKAYHRNHEDEKAIALLKHLLAMPLKMKDDATVKDEGIKLLKGLQ